MSEWVFVMGLIAVMVVVLGVFAVVQAQKQAAIRKQHAGYPQGYWMGHGMGIAMPIGAGIGVAMGNIAVGVGIGAAIGVAIGSGLEKKHKDEVRPPTDEEKKLKRQSILFSIGTLSLGMLVFLITYLVQNRP